MPYLNLIATPATLASDASVGTIKILKNLRPQQASLLSNSSVSAVRRIRSFSRAIAESKFSAAAKFSSLQSLGAVQAQLNSIGLVKYLLNRATVARPKGRLQVATIDPLLTPGTTHPPFTRQRVIRGDLYPLWIVVEGQRLAPLSGQLKVKGTDPVSGQVFEFVKSVSIAPPTEVSAQVQRMSAKVEIEPIDTNGFPDREIELKYAFVLDDGNGRIYTTETGFFTVYPAI